MVIPTQHQVYSTSSGSATIPSFVFSASDPSSTDLNYKLYTGWVNTLTKAIWYLESINPSNGVLTAQWRAVAPMVTSTVNPATSDTIYPLGQPWINSTNNTYWVFVGLSGGLAVWEQLSSSGGGSGILTVTGNSGGAVASDISRNLNLVGQSGQVVVTGNPGTNTLTLSLAGGSTAIDSVQVDAFTAPGTDPVLPNSIGLITIAGAQVPAGSTINAIQTNSLAANSLQVQVQRSSAQASSTVGANGVCHFDASSFSVNSNGFVTYIGGGGSGGLTNIPVDAHTAPGTNPVSINGSNAITFTGGMINAGSAPNSLLVDSLAANSITFQNQISSTQASSTRSANGVAHFNSAHFTVDANGFVSGSGSGGGISEINVQTFTTSGTYTPTDGMVYAWVQVVGGGGGGGGASVDGGAASPSGSGGGGGLSASKVYDAATIGASQTVTIGAGGAGGSAAADGTAGAATSFGALLVCAGGVQGQYMRTNGPIQEGGDGGQALTGTADYSTFGGGGGYSLNISTAVVSGAGGSTPFSPGGKPRGIPADGVPGGGYGGGGSGGVATAGTPATGGNGDDGIVIVTEYIS